MTKRKIREHIFAMLFQADFHKEEELNEQAALYMEGVENASRKARTEIEEKFQAIVACIPQLDACIEAKAKGWDLNRMAKADVTILRLAIYEIIYDREVPNPVAINEAVELSKQYGTDKSASFINGILAAVAKEHPEEKTVDGND